jgi:exonuclease 3'-5' domain-containing protein 2
MSKETIVASERYFPNTFNDEPRIQLLAKDQSLIEVISQVEACRLMRNGFCKLLIKKPPAIQFQLETEKWDKRFKSNNAPRWFRDTDLWLTARRTNLYGNYRVSHPDGYVMFHCDSSKILWYLNRDLVDIVSEEPPTFQLKFAPSGIGHLGDDYYLTEKINQCVNCGSTHNLSRHHVMPRVFRKFMPDEIKEHNYHDVLLLCIDCHCQYELKASKFKQEICSEFGILINDGAGQKYIHEIGETTKTARALINYGDVIPEPRLSYLMGIIRKALDGREPTEEDLQFLASRNPWRVSSDDEESETSSYGEVVVKKIKELNQIQEFTERWRQHFISSMNPQFLPKHWDVTKSLTRERTV